MVAPDEPPRNLTFQQTLSSQVSLQWKPVHPYHLNGKLRGYKVKYKQTDSSIEKTFVFNVNGTEQSRRKRRATETDTVSFILKELKPFTNYSVVVLAFTVKDGVPTLKYYFATAEAGMSHVYEL